MTRPPISSKRRTVQATPLVDTAYVLAGTVLVALAFNLLMRPNQLASGGLPGLSLLIERVTGVAPALTQAVINLVLLFAGWSVLGREFALRSLLGSIVLPVTVALTQHWPALTHDRMLAVICGGAATGIGVGLVFRGRGSVGGFSTVALMLHRRAGISIDRTFMALDGLVGVCALTVFPAEAVLGALVAIYIVGRAARATLTGPNNAQFALIITATPDPIREAILRELDLGLTAVPGRGGYTGQDREVLMVVMRPTDVPRLKATVRALDPTAFVVLVEASEVLGYGFQPHL